MKSLKNKKSKSRLLLIGSLLILIGSLYIIYNLYDEYRITAIENENIEYFFNDEENVKNQETSSTKILNNKVNYNYIAVLEIPKINLKRGLTLDNYYNNVDRNIEILADSTMPDVVGGNFILAGHSGTGRKAYFNNLNKLVMGDFVYVYYDHIQYIYKVNYIYEVEKNLYLPLYKDKDQTSVTMVTCKYKTNKQIVIVADLVGTNNYNKEE